MASDPTTSGESFAMAAEGIAVHPPKSSATSNKNKVHPDQTTQDPEDPPAQRKEPPLQIPNDESDAKKKRCRALVAILAVLSLVVALVFVILSVNESNKPLPAARGTNPPQEPPATPDDNEDTPVDIFTTDFEPDGSLLSLYQVKLNGDVKGCSKSILSTMKISCPVGALLLDKVGAGKNDQDSLPVLDTDSLSQTAHVTQDLSCHQTGIDTVSCPAKAVTQVNVACYGGSEQELLPQITLLDEDDSNYTCSKDLEQTTREAPGGVTITYGGSVSYDVSLSHMCGSSNGIVQHPVATPECQTLGSDNKSCLVSASCSSFVTCDEVRKQDCTGDDFCEVKFDPQDESNVVTASSPLDELCMQPFTRSIPDGDACDYNPMCQSGVCVKGICEPKPREEGAVCEEDDDCTSGLCTPSWNKDSTIQTCCAGRRAVGYSGRPYCTSSVPDDLQPVGGPCEADHFCFTSFCELGICRDASLRWAQVGETVKENNGWFQTMSGDGSVVAISLEDGVGVFQYKGETDEWTPLGNVLFEGEAFGFVLALSDDGRVLAVGDHTHSASGQVRVYELDEETPTWKQRGESIVGEGNEDGYTDATGSSIALSSDGKTLAVGSSWSSVNGANSGSLRVYQYKYEYGSVGSWSWKQMGQTLHGEAASDFFAWKKGLSLSGSGMVLAVGSAGHGPSYDSKRGHVQVWAYDCATSSWLQRGDDIDGEKIDDQSGWSLDLSKDGSTVAIGSPSTKAGQIRVFRYSPGGWWYKLGQSLDGPTRESTFGLDGVTLSADGSLLAVPDTQKSEEEDSFEGRVNVFRLSEGDTWQPFGNVIEGTNGAELGKSISASSDGQTLSVGSANGVLVFRLQ